jgi:hypothetical protein
MHYKNKIINNNTPATSSTGLKCLVKNAAYVHSVREDTYYSYIEGLSDLYGAVPYNEKPSKGERCVAIHFTPLEPL